MSTMRWTTTTESECDEAVSAATLAVNRGELVVIPTDTVYGIGADAFDAAAVAALLAAKGRDRSMPPPVLISSATTLDALASQVPEWARALVQEFWPGPLTLVCHQQGSLNWDLGETLGTVAVRVPDHPVALAVLERTGPLAVSSANSHGLPAARDVDEAQEMRPAVLSELRVLASANFDSQPLLCVVLAGDARLRPRAARCADWTGRRG